MPNRRGPASWFGEGALLRETGRLEEVEDVLVNYARVAQTRADRGEALLRCEAVYARYPDSGGSYGGPERSLLTIIRLRMWRLHLGSDLVQGPGQEVGGAHPRLDRPERMFDLLRRMCLTSGAPSRRYAARIPVR